MTARLATRPGPRRRGAAAAGETGSATARRRSSALDTTTSATTAASCTTASAAAVARSSRTTAYRYISVSMVARAGPPSTSTTPNEVNENRNTMTEAAAIDGASRGRTTRRKTSSRDAPSTLA